jgi:hypothetical protein
VRNGVVAGEEVRVSSVRRLVLVWALGVVVVAGVAAGQAAGGGAGVRGGSSVPAYDHIMVVVEENHVSRM